MAWRHNHGRRVKKPGRQVNRSGALPGPNARTLCRADKKPLMRPKTRETRALALYHLTSGGKLMR